MEEFRKVGMNTVLGVLMLASRTLGFLLLLWFVLLFSINCL